MSDNTEMTFDKEQLNTNYIFKMFKHKYDIIKNGNMKFTPEQSRVILNYYLKEGMGFNGGYSPLCEGYSIQSVKITHNTMLFKIVEWKKKDE